jgi:hypothetical protein
MLPTEPVTCLPGKGPGPLFGGPEARTGGGFFPPSTTAGGGVLGAGGLGAGVMLAGTTKTCGQAGFGQRTA